MGSRKIIEVNNVSKKYELHHLESDKKNNSVDLWALQNVSFAVYEGESIGIIGPNGSGKSTLLKILSGITKPTTGEIIINGRVGSILDIGAGFNQELSGKENVFLNGQILGFSKKEIKEKYDEIVRFSEIGKFINEPVKYYSNGMYLRLAFSIIAHLNFDVYLFDEVMSVGDTSFRAKVAAFLNNRKTMILVSHNQQEIVNNTNRLITLKEGKIAATESIEYFTETIDYSRNTLDFDGGIITISKTEEENQLVFCAKTTFNQPHNQTQNWTIHLKDSLGNTITACVGHLDNEFKYTTDFECVQTFRLNKKIYRNGSYSLAFYLTKLGIYTNIKPSHNFNFLIENNAHTGGYDCVICGPVFYPNTIK